jgi:hypothetical protein
MDEPARDYDAATSKALNTAPLPFTSLHNSSPKNHPKTAVIVFGAPFLVLFWRSKKVRKKTFEKEHPYKYRNVPLRETLLESMEGNGRHRCAVGGSFWRSKKNRNRYI